MSAAKLRIGLIGAGENSRKRHIPGLQAISGVEIVAVCNRRPASAQAVARDFGIPKIAAHWEEIVTDPGIDAVVIGTWPYLHCPITIAALEAEKHVLCEARMSLNAAEARSMLKTSREHPDRVAQLVPSPFGLKGDAVVKRLLAEGFIGVLREFQVVGMNGALADPTAPLSWRQDATLSGLNMLTLGILHETLVRWLPSPVSVVAQAHAFIARRIDAESGLRRVVGTPDSVQALTVLPNGARGVYRFSGVVPLGGDMAITLYGTEGMLCYSLSDDRLFGIQGKGGQLTEIAIPESEARGWRVEADFVESIRDGTPVRYTNFETGDAYMEFTEAVAESAQSGRVVELPQPESDTE